MTHDAKSLLDALGRVPDGWTCRIDFTNDSRPHVNVTLSNARDSLRGWACDSPLEAALASAVNDAAGQLPKPQPTAEEIVAASLERDRGDDNPSRVARNVLHALRRAGHLAEGR